MLGNPTKAKQKLNWAPKTKFKELAKMMYEEDLKNDFYEHVDFNLKFDATEFYSHEKLIDINMSGIRWALERMKIDTPIVFASDLGVDGCKSSLNANLVRAVGGTTYISGPSGKDYINMSYFDGIDVEYFQPEVENFYSCLYNLV